jgi:phage terminase large subunit
MTVGCALLLRAIISGEKWAIVTGSLDKSMIIMRQSIQHLFDNSLFVSQLEVDEPIERLKRERSKTRLTFKTGGEIAVFTAQSKFKTQIKSSLMGFGSPNVIEDESALIDDDLHSMVMRMLGGQKDNFLLKIGNPFERNHFYRTWNSNKYTKVFIDYKEAIKEGRYSESFIEEMRSEAFFPVFYECKFPEADEIDSRGYRVLITPEQIKERMKPTESRGELTLGVDIGGGGDYNAYVVRSGNYAYLLNKNRSNDTMTNVSEVERAIDRLKIDPSNVFIDDTGIGRGVSDRLKEKGLYVNDVSFGAPSPEILFTNLKALLFWEAKKWVLNNYLESNDDFLQLAWIKYKIDSDKKLKLESKDDLKKRGFKSPDIADALALTFAPSFKLEMVII